jgi:predicted amidohydrolase YtcJ
VYSLFARLLLSLSLGAASLLAQPTLVLRNGRIWTGSASRPWAQAVALSGNKILAVGDDAMVARLAGPKTESIDLGGRLAIPGFNDAHIHFLGGARGLRQVDLTGVCTLEEMQRRVRDFAERNPSTEWITGSGWEYYCFPEGRLAHKEDLDAAVKDRPVFLSAYDGHSGWANSRALRIGEVSRVTAFQGFGEIVRHPGSGEPTGLLKEGAQSLVRRHVPRPTRAQDLLSLEDGMKLAASLGITSLQNASGTPDELALYQELEHSGKLTVRTGMVMSISSKDPPLDAFAGLMRTVKSPLLKVGGVKIMLDGVIETHTAAMLEPYSDRPGSEDRGEPVWDAATLQDLVVRADRLGLQIYIHAIGDRAVRMALDAYEFATRRNAGRYHLIQKDRRYRIEHIEVADPADVPRFAKLGVLPVMQPIHADPATVEVWSKAVGPARLKQAFAWGAFEKSGARLTFSSDWPACISLNPIRGIHNAVNRQTIDGRPPGGWLPDQRVSLETALRAYTVNGAIASFEEKNKGTIEPGKLADLVVLTEDLFRIPPSRIHESKVWMTVFDGRILYRRPAP